VPSLQSLRNFLFFLFLLFLPNQLGLHFWPTWTYVQGLRIDYLSPTFYLSHLLFFAPLLVFCVSRVTSLSRPHLLKGLPTICLLILLLVLQLLTSISPPLSLYKYSIFLLLFLIFLYISKRETTPTWIWSGLSLGVFWATLIAVFQFRTQQSLGFWILGERDFSILTPGIAKSFIDIPPIGVSIVQGLFLRPYSTFSHPNSLAGFMLVSMFLLIALRKHLPGAVFVLSILSSVTTVILTGSRTAIIVLIFSALYFLVSSLKYKSHKFFLSVLLLIPLASYLFISSNLFSGQSFSRRLEENKIAFIMFQNNSLFGVGLGNFIPALGHFIPSATYSSLSTPTLWLQPVHNIYLLLASETGAVGVSLFLFLLVRTLVKLRHLNNKPLFFALLAVLLTGFLDHYWLTLLQNQILFSILLGYIWKAKS